jgi:hypothetical protein
LGPTNSTASLETDAKLVDRDEAEDGLRNAPVNKILTIQVSNNRTSPTRTVFLNGLIDLDLDGVWSGSGEDEWFIKNATIKLDPGEETVVQVSVPTEINTWLRFLLSDSPIESETWDGSGYWKDGEVEDYRIVWESYETPTPWTPTNTPTATFTPTEKVIYTTPGGNSIATPTDTATPTTTEKTICTKCGGPTNTPTPTDPPPPAEAPIWSGNVCGGTDFYSEPGGHFIRRIDQSEHIYMLVMLSDGWTKIQAGNDIGWIWVDWRVAEFGYDGHPCQ